MLHSILTLARVSNLPTVWSNCLAAWLIAGAGPSWTLLLVLAAASLLYAGGCTLNDAFDARWDTQNRPERLIPSGRMKRGTVWVVGILEMAAGVALFPKSAFPEWSWWLPPALAACIVAYDAWHKQSPWSVVTMGACRWLLYLSAAAAAGSIRVAGITGLTLWVYIIVLSLVARGEARAKPESSPNTRRLLLAVPVMLVSVAWLTGATLASMCLAPLVFCAGMAVLLPRRGVPVPVLVNRLLAAIPLIDLCLCILITDWRSLAAALWLAAFPAAIGLSLLFQRWFRAT